MIDEDRPASPSGEPNAGGTGATGDAPGHADALFAEYLRSKDSGADFDGFVGRHAPEADALRALHSLWLAEALPAAPKERELAGDGGALEGALHAFAQAPSATPDPLTFDTIPNYKLVEVLGEGGFGIVYRAEQERPIRRTVAIKVVKLGMDTREAVARFETERQALALMSHASIAKVHDAGATERGRPFFVMEYIRGEPITSYCENHNLGIDARLELFLTVCDAVEHAHQKAVIHRDIKPSNVLVTLESERAVPKVIDFGIAKATGTELTEHTMRTEMGQVIGTPAYMSPEQADVSRSDVDTRSDIYSLGVLLYELLASVTPFERDAFLRKSFDEILRFIREEEPPRPSVRLERLAREQGDATSAKRLRHEARRLRGDLDWIVLKALAKDRTRRYGAVSDLAADIRRHLRHEPVLAGPPSAAYRLRKLVRKHRVAVSVTTLIAALALITSGVFIYRNERAFRSLFDGTIAAVQEKRLDVAKRHLAALLQDHYGRPAVRDLETAVAGLESQLRSEESAGLIETARADWKRYVDKRNEVREANLAWKEERDSLPTSAPPWKRLQEFKLDDRLEAARKEMQVLYVSALAVYQRAIDIAPQGSVAQSNARTAFARVHQELEDLADREGGVTFSPDFFRQRVADLDASILPRGIATVRLKTRPSGAAIYCFRYEEREKRLMPLPFDPRAAVSRVEDGILREPALVVERVLDGRCPLRAGDVLLELNGRPVRALTDLSRAWEGLEADAPIDAGIEREGKRISLALTLAPRAAPPAAGQDKENVFADLVELRDRLGFSLAGYPLQLVEGSKLGNTARDHPLEFLLPNGSYLLVLRLEGYAETRYPIVVSGIDLSFEVRMLKEGEVPALFIHVPAGPFHHGGDSPAAFQALPLEEITLEGFLISRYELTFDEYLQFLNDPLVGVDEKGAVAPTQENAKSYFQALVEHGRPSPGKITVVPREEDSGRWLVQRTESGSWQIHPELVRSGSWPVYGVSRYAAEEYAHWRTQRAAGGLVSRFRLPVDDEWEKAARGVDRRKFVWGDYPAMCFAWVLAGNPRRGQKTVEEVGFMPCDESVYGVRDLTGSVSEHAVGRPLPRYPFSSSRGGNYWMADEYYARAATRNGLLPHISVKSTGFRLVADLRSEEE